MQNNDSKDATGASLNKTGLAAVRLWTKITEMLDKRSGAIARSLAQRGCHLALADISEAGLAMIADLTGLGEALAAHDGGATRTRPGPAPITASANTAARAPSVPMSAVVRSSSALSIWLAMVRFQIRS